MKYLSFLLVLTFYSCQPQLVEPEKMVIEGYEIGQKINRANVSRIKEDPAYEIDGMPISLSAYQTLEYFNLPIASYQLNKNKNISFTLLDKVILDINVNQYPTTQKDKLVDILTQKFQGKPVYKTKSKKQFLQPYTIKTAEYTWRTQDTKLQIGAGYMKKTNAPDQPFEYWNLSYTNNRLKEQIVENYKKKLFSNEVDSLAYMNALNAIKNRLMPPRNGSYIDLYKNGKKKVTGSYKSGKKDGEWTKWFENGQMEDKGHYQRNKKTGVWEEWHNNGIKADSATYKKDEYIGKRLMWHRNGQLLLESYWSNRHRQIGTWTRFYENGQMESFNEMDNNGEEHGKYLLYYESGKIQREIIHKHGKEVSNKFWFENGKLHVY